MAFGVQHNTFDQRICFVYWCDFIKEAVADCRPLLDYLRARKSGGHTYEDLVRLEKRWTSAKRFWQLGETDPVCNLYSITTNQAAIIALFRVINC
jgi:hypothetical protein